jgi:hypothetical protein
MVLVVTSDGSDTGAAGYTPADLAYFSDLIEGRDAVSWAAWWRGNDVQLRARLPRAEYLRLKFKRLEHAADVLTTAGVRYSWTALGRVRQRAADLDPRFVDEAGLPTMVWFDSLGALAKAAEAGEPAAVRRAARDRVTQTRRSRPPGVQALCELVYDAEVLHELGSSLPDHRCRAAATALLEAVAGTDSDDDVDELPAIHAARAALARLGRVDDVEGELA